jgi:hypothetical protein
VADTTSGQTLTFKFALYENQTGGEAVWNESQQVTPGDAGKYSVLLGAATENGLPQNVFSSAQAKWLGITIGDGQESARTLLVATPYSLKASDAETLGGHPITDFALKSALPAGGTNVTQINVGNGITGGGTGPTVTLGLSNSYLANLGNEVYAQLGANNLMTGTNSFGAGKVSIGGSPALAVATVKAGTGITVSPSGTTAVSIALNESTLLSLGNTVYAQLGAANTFTKGQTFKAAVTFASGQTFPGTVSLSGNNTFSGSNTFSKVITFASGQTFPGAGTGTITGITTSSPLSGSGTSGSVALSLNTSALESTLNGVYAGLNAANLFNATNTFGGRVNILGSSGSPELNVTNAEGDGGYGIYATTAASVGYGIYGVSLSPSTEGQAFSGNAFGGAIWADSSADENSSDVFGALLASADNNQAAVFLNDSSESTTVILENDGGGGPGAVVHMMVASSPKGICGISGTGDVKCSGRFTAEVPLSGTSQQVEVYAMQSSENWFEDFGSAELSNGQATVAIDPKFAQIVNTGVQYHVFLTPHGDSDGLYVANLAPGSFEVRESKGGKSNISFDYRIVAKRNGHETERLADATAEMRQMTKPRDQLAAKRANIKAHSVK